MHTTLTDQEILMKHDRSARPRARMELKIVNRLIADAATVGYTLRVREYENDGEIGYDVKSAIFNLDDAYVEVSDDVNGGWIGWVYLVMGNNGYDVISDYSENLRNFLRGCDELADRLMDGLE